MKKKGKIVSGIGIGLLAALAVGADVACGIFANTISIYLNGFGTSTANVDYKSGDALCQQIAEEGILLLKNQNGYLPKKSMDRLAVFGWGASDGGFLTAGGGSGDSASRGNGTKTTLLQALKKEGISYYQDIIDYYDKYDNGANRHPSNYWNAAYPYFELIEPNYSEVQDYVPKAREFSDTALFVVSRVGGEGQDIPRIQKKAHSHPTDETRSFLQLSQEEKDLLAGIEEEFDDVIVIINSMSPMELGWVEKDDKIKAAFSINALGQSGTVSLAKMLKGELTPSGKTADTFAYDGASAPSYAIGPNCREWDSSKGSGKSFSNDSSSHYMAYTENIYIGYKWYETADEEGYFHDVDNEYGQGYEGVVQYPFGYGLSYADFDWNVISVSPEVGSVITPDTEIKIKVDVSNISEEYAGRDVVQLYYSAPYTKGGIEKSAVNLGDFAKTIQLNPKGQKDHSQIVELSLFGRDMKSYDCYDKNQNGFKGYELEKGEYTLSLRHDSHHVDDDKNAFIRYQVAEDYQLDKDEVTQTEVKNRFTGEDAEADCPIDAYEQLTYLTRADFNSTFPKIGNYKIKKTDAMKAIGNSTYKSTKKTDNYDEMPVTGADNGYQLYDDDPNDSSKKIPNQELMYDLGSDYDSETYYEVLDQVKKEELFNNVLGGGYSTHAIPSLNKPTLNDFDGPSGINDTNQAASSKSSWSSFPSETVIGQAWNKNLAYSLGLCVASEGLASGVNGWYAPACNIHRSPYDGRNFEYYSEDPILSGYLSANTVLGCKNNGMYCYTKHFAVNETENGRSGLYTFLTEQDLRENILKPFEMTVKLGKGNAIMSSFNRIGAIWAGGSYSLLTEILREEWGFRGSVVTDYSNGGDYMNVDMGLRAGNDIWLNGTRSTTTLGFDDRNSVNGVSLARESLHNVLYTLTNTYYTAKEHQKKIESGEIKEGYSVNLDSTMSGGNYDMSWVWLLVLLNVVLLGGASVLVYFAYIRKDRKKAE